MSYLLGRLKLVQAGVLLSVGLLFFLITFWAMESVWQDRSDDILNNFRVSDSEIMGEFFSNLNHLRSVPELSSCSDEMLRLLRITEYRSHYWHEYAYVEDGVLLCSTSLGVLDTPATEPAADFNINGLSYTRKAPVALLDGSVTAMSVQAGNYRALLRPLDNPAENHDWISFGSFVSARDGFKHIYGDSELSPRPQAVSGAVELYRSRIQPDKKLPHEQIISWYEQGSLVSQLCLRQSSCAVVSIDIIKYFAADVEITAAILICFVAMLMLSSALTPLLYQRYFCLNRQVKRGIKPGRVICHYQPIIPASPNERFSCEVLCRWYAESGKIVFPDQFLSEVESNGQSCQLTEIVCETAVKELDQAGLLGRIGFSINAFPEDIETGLLLQLVEDYLPDEYCCCLVVELTEKEINNMELLCSGIQALRSKGVRIAIDDFGTGYSNLNHLKQLQVDAIKIDKSFIWGLEEGMIHAGLVQNIVYIAETLQLDCVAEGVEDKQQLELLRKLDVNYFQGYYFSKPVPITTLANDMNQRMEREEVRTVIRAA